MIRKVIIECLLLAALPAGTAAETFYDRGDEGWFFYKSPPDPEPKTADDESQSQVAAADQLNDDGPEKIFSVSWLKKNLEHYRNIAIDDPTEENIRAYLYLQRLVLEKSSRFARMFQQVITGDPYLDAVSTRPIATWGSNLVDSRAQKMRQSLLEKIAKNAGILYIFSSDDFYSTSFTPVFAGFVRRYGFEVKAVSLDSSSDPAGILDRVQYDPRARAAFAVRVTPALFLMTAGGKTAPLVQGLVSQDDLARRVLSAAVRLGVVGEDEYVQTGAVQNEISLEEKGIDSTGNADSGRLPSPEKILKMLKQE